MSKHTVKKTERELTDLEKYLQCMGQMKGGYL